MTQNEFDQKIATAKAEHDIPVVFEGEKFDDIINIEVPIAIIFLGCHFKTLRLRNQAIGRHILLRFSRCRIIELEINYKTQKIFEKCVIDKAKITFANAEITCSKVKELVLHQSEVSKLHIKNSKIGYIQIKQSLLREFELENVTTERFNAHFTDEFAIKIYGGKFLDFFQAIIPFDGIANRLEIHGTSFSKECKFRIKGNTSSVKLSHLDLSNANFLVDSDDPFGFRYSFVNFPDNVGTLVGESNRDQSSFYRMMKSLCEQNSDHIQARIFASMELESYYLYLIKDKKESNLKHLPLFTSKLSNDFGRNWWWPMLWLIGTSAVSFSFSSILILSNYSCPESIPIGASLWEKGIFFEYLLPVRSFDIFEGYRTGTLVHFVDVLQRIFSGSLIYQIIRAFRFHVAK